MIKLLKKLWKKIFGKNSKTLPQNVGVEPTPKPQHCGSHNRYKKSCKACQEIVA